jgi:hypothetical protein
MQGDTWHQETCSAWHMVNPFTINDANSLVNSMKNNLPIYFTLFQIAKVRHRKT